MEQTFFSRNKTWIVIVGLIVLVLLWAGSQYNRFVSQGEAINSQWAQVENQLQRRFDLIPNLVGTVKGVSKQEKDVIAEITEARTRYSGASSVDAKAAAAGQVESALGRLLVITENYPQLQSSQAYKDLMTSLEGTENRLAVERMKYNDLVKVYNTSVRRFPGSVFASVFGFSEHAYFEVSEQAKVNPTVDFTN